MTMTNYIHRLAITVATEIKKKITEATPWSIEVFAELVRECEAQNLDRRTTRSVVYTVLDMIPHIDKAFKASVWEEISLEFLPAKSYTSTKVSLADLDEAGIEAHLARVFAAKAKAKV
jgi:hypothetical protein